MKIHSDNLPLKAHPVTLFFGHQAKTGVVMNILGIMAVSLAMNTWGVAMFDLGTYPEWAHPANTSALATDARLLVPSVNATH